MCLMFKLQICFPETLQMESFDCVVKKSQRDTVTYQLLLLSSKGGQTAARLDQQWDKSKVMPLTDVELLYPQMTATLRVCK